MDVKVQSLIEQFGITEQTREFLAKPKYMYIDGQFQSDLDRPTIAAINPCTGGKITEIPLGTAADVDTAVKAAKHAMYKGEWSKFSPRDREQALRKLAELIRENAQTIAEIESLDSGKAISGCKAVDLNVAANTFEYYAGWATKIEGSTRDTSFPVDCVTYTRKQPVGVVGAIVPWNWPLGMAVWKMAAPLAVGCSIVLKPAEITSLSMLYLMELAEKAGFPKGAINIVTGKGSVVGNAIVEHKDVSKISFTGSTNTGKIVGQAAISRVAHATLELGGKSPMIAFEDADIDALAKNTLGSVYFNAGQVCSAGSRLYVHRSRYDEAVAKIKAIAEGIKLGPCLDPETVMGPVINKTQQDSILGFIEQGKAQGATLVTGGEALASDGTFVRPTLFADCTNDMTIVQEEIFGPVLVVIPFDTEEEAVELANDNIYGLASSIWTKDLSRANRLIPQIDAGAVWVNIHDPGDPAMPFGGFKQSGIGKDLGPEQLAYFLETKSVWIKI
ncbi:aldehyde dehydrogenase [Paraferrimonas sp. SM1919]|uniref:aldehyde dehydrogenase family protein n=1 Tax=Paraferrimonas sp. SM1919 TaxID=2662263 RepID=UPI0013D6E571|nr:aldehyde dehydrogenase family protein [Paraferrimonas sp. SM1919]